MHGARLRIRSGLLAGTALAATLATTIAAAAVPHQPQASAEPLPTREMCMPIKPTAAAEAGAGVFNRAISLKIG